MTYTIDGKILRVLLFLHSQINHISPLPMPSDDRNAMTQTQTQTQTSFIQQKKIQVQYQVYITFMNIQLIISPWHINDYKHVGRPPLRSYLTADMEATRKEEACTAVMKTAIQLIVN